MMKRWNRLGAVVLAAVLAGSGRVALGEGAMGVWNDNVKMVVTYQPLTVTAKVGDWVSFDSRKLHPTQFCLGYREVEYKGKLLSGYSAEVDSHDSKKSVYPYLAKKDIPMVIAPDGTVYLTDGHHTLAGLIGSTQKDKTALGHVVANFYGKPQAEFVAFMTDPKNNDVYLYGPSGNGLLNRPGAMGFEALPTTVFSEQSAGRMENDDYRSLGWAMKDSGYSSIVDATHGEDELPENFIEFRWADLLRGKIVWNNASDDSFYIASQNADVLAHSEVTTDMSGGFAAHDMPGYVQADAGGKYVLNITNEDRIEGDIVPSVQALTTLNINAAANTSIVVGGRISNVAELRVNGGGEAMPNIDKGGFLPKVGIAAGRGLVVLSGECAMTGGTVVSGGELMVNGILRNSAVEVEKGALLRGVGVVGSISGGGVVEPGGSIGILGANSVRGDGGLRFAFEFSGKSPKFGDGRNSRNGVLNLTGAVPFESALSAGNEVDVYLRVDQVHAGDVFVGGFQAKVPFENFVSGASVKMFVADPAGAVLMGTTHYSVLDESKFVGKMDVAEVKGHGFATRFTVMAR